MKHLTLILSALVCLAWFSCRQDPALPEPTTNNDTTEAEKPSLPVNPPNPAAANPADTIVGTYKGTTEKYSVVTTPPGSTPTSTFDSSYADSVVVYLDATDTVNTFHVRYPTFDPTMFNDYTTKQLTYTKGNEYVISPHNHRVFHLKIDEVADTLYFKEYLASPYTNQTVIFRGNK